MIKNRKSGIRQLLSTMLKIGTIGFGGGTALIPVIEEEVVENNGLTDEEEFNKDVIIANITPGALPVEIAAGVGRKMHGITGMLLAAASMAFPGSILTILLISLINQSSGFIVSQILFASVGVTAYIIFMLHEYTKNTIAECRKNSMCTIGIIFITLVFVLTVGKELYQIAGFNKTPIFDISTVQILIMAFFIIFFTNGNFYKIRLIISVVITILYCICISSFKNIIPIPYAVWILRGIMLILALWGLFTGISEKIAFDLKPFKRFIKEEFIWFIFLFIFSVPAIILCPKTLLFIGKGVISVLMSFGGGDAYLAVADGLFIDSGMVSYSDFYSKIASVANALPGSILCKILSGVGYYIGYGHGGIFTGLCVALSGFTCSIAASGGTFSAVAYLYERFENMNIFQVLKKYIRPIVAGLLLTVSVSMLYQNISIAQTQKCPVLFIIFITAAIYVINIFWRKKEILKPVFRVLLSAVISLAACNIILLF